jgi:predicted aminopeptidase
MLFNSCAKLGYLIDQGAGQWNLLYDSTSNEEVLKDLTVKQEYRDKIKKIEEYKKYFYNYFSKKTTDIYSETVFLKREAVTYLVIASPFDDIKAKEECFIFMGCFPYLGFFDKSGALNHAKELETENYVTYVRPVYAYSTLGYFDDNILSTFFLYKEDGLANLIFHELFHTIFFAKGDVELNENLAMFFSEKLVNEYFNYSDQNKRDKIDSKLKSQKLKKFVVGKVQKLKDLYGMEKEGTRETFQETFNTFMSEEFRPQARKLCQSLKLQKCDIAEREWNNASFSAFLTYENKIDKLHTLFNLKKMSLVDFFLYIEKKYKEYKKGDEKTSFNEFLLGK